MASSGSFYQLPDELLLKIFTHLDIPDLVLNIQHVDSHWKAVVQDISFWRDYVFTVEKQMADKEIILLLKNMPSLRALVATRGATNQLIHTVCKTSKLITRLELHHDHRFTTFHLETIVKNLPHIQHLAFPLLERDSENAMKYSALIQKFHELVSLRLLGYGFNAEDCFFLKGIANACPVLQEIDLGSHDFKASDVLSFLNVKRKAITKYFSQATHSVDIISSLCYCKQLQTLHFASCGTWLWSLIPLIDLPNLKHFGISQFEAYDFSTIMESLQETTMSNLLKLDIRSCTLDPELFENTLYKCVHLKILILQSCDLTNGGDFQHIGKCIYLEYLDVRDTGITDEEVEIFAEKCRKLKHLDMSDCSLITDFGFQCLMKCSELQTLKLNGTHITGQNFHLIPLHLTKLSELHVEYCNQLDFQYIQQLQEQMIHLQIHTSRNVTVPEYSVDLAGANIFAELY